MFEQIALTFLVLLLFGSYKGKLLSATETARGLFVHASSLVCNRLMATWKLDLNIALAAMEVLTGLAHVSLQTAHPLMCKRTVNWICTSCFPMECVTMYN